MCGITGYFCLDHSRIDPGVLSSMNERMLHRGPDEAGFWHHENIGLAMRRLSILDVEGGHQPQTDESGRIRVVFNGEIYNHDQLRQKLQDKGHVFQTRSDTEVIAHMFAAYGADFARQLDGMYAIALWDQTNKSLHLYRDPFGIKPLFWFPLEKGGVAFGSEVRALLAHPQCPRSANRKALARYLFCDYFPGQDSHLENVKKLPPGHHLVINHQGIKLRCFQDPTLEKVDVPTDPREQQQQFRDLLVESVRLQRLADVEVGIFLSGGLDSSSLVWAHRQVDGGAPLKTFSISFSDPNFDESSHAELVARYFQTDHQVQRVDASSLPEMLPKALDLLDEPLGDASILPTSLLARFTRSQVKVAMGGDGGDEMFGGYPTYRAHLMHRLYALSPKIFHRAFFQPLAGQLPVKFGDFTWEFKVKKFLRGAHKPALERHLDWMGGPSSADMGQLMPDIEAEDLLTAHRNIFQAQGQDHLEETCRIRRLDMFSFLAEGVLVKLDRATMSASLEGRVPFLTNALASFAFSLPRQVHHDRKQTKMLMRSAMTGLLPPSIIQRPKKGFGVPMDTWLAGPLKEWAGDLLFSSCLQDLGLDRNTLETWWKQHQTRQVNRKKHLWPVLVLAHVWQRLQSRVW